MGRTCQCQCQHTHHKPCQGRPVQDVPTLYGRIPMCGACTEGMIRAGAYDLGFLAAHWAGVVQTP